MVTRSSLELMLDKLQQLEKQPTATPIPPALPVRPVSRARLPRPRRPLQLNFDKRINSQENGRTKEESGESAASAAQFDHFLKRKQESENWKEKGICKIQKWYRGHRIRCCYKELRREVIGLQSCIRGEIARRGFRHTSQIKLVEDQTLQVQYGSLVDLEKRVLKTQAKLRGKKEENMALKRKLVEIEKKWQQYEERMKSMEKEWQDELTYIQECLAAGNKTGMIVVECEESEVGEEQVLVKLRPHEELRKLKLRFKAWKKEYKDKQRDAQSTFAKLAANTHNNWWGRLSH